MTSSEPEASGAPVAVETTDSGIPVIGPVAWGTHCCHFFETDDDYLATICRYFAAGIEARQRCLWIVSDELPVEQAKAALVQRLPAADAAIGSGGLLIVAGRDVHFRDRPFRQERVFERIAQALKEGLAKGFDGMRVAGDVAPLLDDAGSALTRFERDLDGQIAGNRLVILCCYRLRGASGGQVFNVAGAHDFAVARCRGSWQVMEASQAVGASAEIQRLNAQLTQRIGQRTRQLEAVNDALVESEELFRFIAENMSDVISLYDTDGTPVYVSPTAPWKSGPIGDVIRHIARPEDVGLLERGWERVLSGEPVTLMFRYKVSKDEWRWLESTGTMVHFQGRKHVLSVSRDVTDRRSLEDQLQHAQKMEALGRLAGGVAHDFNNVLTAISSYSGVLRRLLPPGSDSSEAAQEIAKAVERASKLTRQLLTFARRDVHDPRAIDAAEVTRNIENMLRVVVRDDIALSIAIPAEPLWTRIDPGTLEQVLMNLVVNARDATPPGGRIAISCSAADAETGNSTPRYVAPGRYVRISVADTGCGISPELSERVFEPFFTTKGADQGTGLGLSTVFAIVKQADGYVWIENGAEGGTTIVVLLPAAEEGGA